MTQLESARQNIITAEMEFVAKRDLEQAVELLDPQSQAL